MEEKKCSKCGKILPLGQFYKHRHRDGNMGYKSECKDCNKATVAKWQKNNPEKVRAASVRWYHNNKGKRNRGRTKWQQDNPDKCRAIGARWQKNNREKRNRYLRERMANDISFKLMKNISRAMRSALKRNAKSGHTIDLLGCSIKELREHLERLFTFGMAWDNYGIGGWEIDHIIPLSYFDHSDPEQQKRAWHYTNLRPLWAKDNLKKHGKIIEIQLLLQ